MATVSLVRIGAVSPGAMEAVADAIVDYLGCQAVLQNGSLAPDSAFDAARGQYWSTALLKELDAMQAGDGTKILGLTEVDLFIPVLTFVFGEALLDQSPAVISLRRLRPSFYGLPDDPALMLRRAQTEALHELGHTFGLIHCPDHACTMKASRVADEIDLKGPAFCHDCAARLHGRGLSPKVYS